MPEISVIIPVWNAQQYLNKCVRSVLNQSFADFELILVNDGSTDRSLLYCRALADRDTRIRVLDLPHSGQAAARTAGITAAGGKYIGFIDSDDWVGNEYLEHLHTAITENDADISMCHYICEYADASKTWPNDFEDGNYRGDALEEFKKTHLFCGNDRSIRGISFFIWDKLFKKELVLNNMQYLDSSILRAPDVLIVSACLLDSRCISIVGSPDYHYVQREGSMVHSTSGILYDETARFRTIQKQVLRDKNYTGLEYKVDTRCVYRLSGLAGRLSKSDLPPLAGELKELIRAQREEDGCADWAEAVRKVKEFYLS